MRRSASEVIKNLEMRIARLEKQASYVTSLDFDEFTKSIVGDLSRAYGSTIRANKIESELENFIELVTGEDWTETYEIRLDEKINTTSDHSVEVYCTLIGEYGELSVAFEVDLTNRPLITEIS